MVLVMVEVFGLTIDSRQVVFCLYGSIFVMLVLGSIRFSF